MGEQNVNRETDRDQLRSFTRSLLEDVQALERMLEGGQIESGVNRIGAEQEMFLVDRDMNPALIAPQILESIDDERFTGELGRFNLEANLNPQVLGGRCLSMMEAELDQVLDLARREAQALDCEVLLVGILPTMRQKDLTLDAMMPNPRYQLLNDLLMEERGGKFKLFLKGLDELQVTHDNLMLEACNTSFQIHFQVSPREFASAYNLAQMVSGPLLAAAGNSPVLMQHRLWHESRVGLFQQSMDSRSKAHTARQARQRVSFGDRWVDHSVLEIFREDIARFRILLSIDQGESPLEALDHGRTPALRSLCLHNGTVYRWNRPCYGVKDGQAHLRIEHRMLPAGPTPLDEVANAAFFFGLMIGVEEEYGDVRRCMEFDSAKDNFTAAARYGLKAQLSWAFGRTFDAPTLILEHLLPLARAGLASRGTDTSDIDRYLGTLEERVKRRQTGSAWLLDSLQRSAGNGTLEQRYRSVTAAMLAREIEGQPVHEWELHEAKDNGDWCASFQTVEQVMTTDLFTVGPEDLVDLAANVMDWEHIRHVPVESEDGQLVGIVSHRGLLRLVARGQRDQRPVAVKEVMTKAPVTIRPEMGTLKAIHTMKRHRVSCLPVVDKAGKLVGIVSERDFINIAARLLEQKLREGRG